MKDSKKLKLELGTPSHLRKPRHVVFNPMKAKQHTSEYGIRRLERKSL